MGNWTTYTIVNMHLQHYIVTLDSEDTFLPCSLLTGKVPGRTEKKMKTARTVLVYKTAISVDKPRLAPVRSLGPPIIVTMRKGGVTRAMYCTI